MSEQTSAVLSECGLYRYELRRVWDPKRHLVAFCGLNPSTADATQDDPTIRRERLFAKLWGYGGFIKVNAYALRSTDPNGLRKVSDPLGPDNNQWIERASKDAETFVVCWGAHCSLIRQKEIGRMLAWRPGVYSFGVTKHGRPKHPLFLRVDSRLEPWR